MSTGAIRYVLFSEECGLSEPIAGKFLCENVERFTEGDRALAEVFVREVYNELVFGEDMSEEGKEMYGKFEIVFFDGRTLLFNGWDESSMPITERVTVVFEEENELPRLGESFAE